MSLPPRRQLALLRAHPEPGLEHGMHAAGLFQGHPHIKIFPGDGIDIMSVVPEPPEE